MSIIISLVIARYLYISIVYEFIDIYTYYCLHGFMCIVSEGTVSIII